MATTTKTAQVTNEQVGRVDRIVRALSGLPNSKLQGLFDHGCVTVNGRPCAKGNQRVAAGDSVELRYDPTRGYPEKKRKWNDLSFTVAYEDQHLIVVNKAANILTVPAENGEANSLVDRVSHYLRHTSRRREALVVHRLDRDVSGLLVFAKSRLVQERLIEQFKARKPERLYVAIVAGLLRRASGTFRSHLETGKNLQEYSTRDTKRGKLAITHFRVLRKLKDTTVVEVRLETGRRNQIRVHFADHGHPVLGDPRYGRGKSTHAGWPETRIALHALSLGFEHPATGKSLHFESELPEVMKRFMDHKAKQG